MSGHDGAPSTGFSSDSTRLDATLRVELPQDGQGRHLLLFRYAQHPGHWLWRHVGRVVPENSWFKPVKRVKWVKSKAAFAQFILFLVWKMNVIYKWSLFICIQRYHRCMQFLESKNRPVHLFLSMNCWMLTALCFECASFYDWKDLGCPLTNSSESLIMF